jgi:hypothetical protein
MSDFITKQGDTRNALEAHLKENGVTIDLTNCTVNFILHDDDTVLINRSATITDATNGIVVMNFTESELDNIGEFEGEFKVTFSGGEVETFPNQDYLDIKILKSL